MPDITLKHNIDLTIDDEKFSIVVRMLTGKDKQSLKTLKKAQQKKAEAGDKERKAYEKNQKKLTTARNELLDNQDLYSLEEDSDVKKELLIERKELRAKIAKLEEITDKYEAPDYTQMVKEFDVIPKKQFDLLVSGDDKSRLESFIEEYAFSYSDLWAILNKKIAKAQAKK